MKKPWDTEQLVVTRMGDNILPHKQLLPAFFVSKSLVGQCEVFKFIPLTFRNLLFYLIRNNAVLVYYTFTRFLWRIGALDISETAELDWRSDFRWRFWRERKYVLPKMS